MNDLMGSGRFIDGAESDVAGRYAVVRTVGRGASGLVFEATDRTTDTVVALKVLVDENVEPAARAAFLTEGRLLQQLSHPGVVRISDFGTLAEQPQKLAGVSVPPSAPYLAMEWLGGSDLADRVQSEKLELRTALECARQLATALAAVHEKGVVHRDVKPANVFIVDRGGDGMQTKLTDFGVAMASQNDPHLGAMVGTPGYMAPEQARGDRVDHRCDVFGLGATLFELISGRTPHRAPTVVATLARLVSTPAPRLLEVTHKTPSLVDELVANMLLMDPGARPDCAEVAQHLGAMLRDPDFGRESAEPVSSRIVSPQINARRFVTTVVALGVGNDELPRASLFMQQRGAEVMPLGKDSLVAFLGVRRAHGREAALGVELALHLVSLGARVGVATGRALMDLQRPVGEVVDRASLLARQAADQPLLIDSTTTEFVRNQVSVTSVGPSTWSVREFREGGAMAPRGKLVPFVGRDAEMSRLTACLRRTVEECRSHVVVVSGPPGIGKSRLLKEFVAQVDTLRFGAPPDTERSRGAQPASEPAGPASAGGLTQVMVRCETYGSARALGTAADLLLAMLGLPTGSDGERVREALRDTGALLDDGSLLATLLAGETFPDDVDPQRVRDQLYLSMTELMVKKLRSSPTLVIIEDLQWSDRESVGWLEHMIRRAEHLPVIAVVGARPSFWKDHALRLRAVPHTRIDLRPIQKRAVRAIAQAVLGCEITDPLVEVVAKQAAGSPLFAEELARVIAAGAPADNVPTIEAAVQVSLDALTDSARHLLAAASIFGLSLWDDALRALDCGEVDDGLQRLVDADILLLRPTARFEGVREFGFRHALVREVVYASVDETLCVRYHAAAGVWLESMGDDPATIAQHFDRGQQFASAGRLLETAARRALATSALGDAAGMADRALAFAENATEGFARAQLLDAIYALLDAGGAERVEAISAMNEYAHDERSRLITEGARVRYDHARSYGADVDVRLAAVIEESASLGETAEQARCMATLATRQAFAGALQQADDSANELLELAQRHGLRKAAIDAWQVIGVVRQTRGELSSALQARRNAAAAAREAGHRQREATLTINLGFALTTLGAKGEARAAIERGITMAEEIGSTGTLRLGMMVMLGWSAHFGSDPELDPLLVEPRNRADEAVSSGWMVKDRVTLGTVFYRGCELLENETRLERARDMLRGSASDYRTTDNRDVLPVALGYWAEAERRLGESEQAEKIAAEAADLVEQGAPSLLSEAIIFLTLYDARVDMGLLEQAAAAVRRGMIPLLRRARGLQGTPYVKSFLQLPHHQRLVEIADDLGTVPPELDLLLRLSG